MKGLLQINLTEKSKMSYSSGEKLCLQWNDFQTNLTSAFRDLREDKEFTDVTLACEDGQQVEAHKVVLISSSPFFKSLLQRNKHPHPLIYMRGLKSKDLVAMIDFLYHGEANVYQENLDSFLAIAGELQLKGLHGNQTEAMSEEIQPTKPPARISNTFVEEETVNEGFKPHTRKSKPMTNFSNEPNYETAIALNSNTELSEKVKSMMNFSENAAPGGQKGRARICKVCGKEGNMKNIENHIEANHITVIVLPRNICGKTSPTRSALAIHKSSYHKQ